MTDLLSQNDRNAALSFGWDVCWVYCTRLQKCIVQVLPTSNNAIKSAERLMYAVTLRAQAGDALAQRIVGLVLNPPPPRKKTK